MNKILCIPVITFAGRKFSFVGCSLIKLFQNRRKQFEKLSMALAPELFRLAYWRMSNTQDAEDVVQETYMRAYRSFHTFAPETNIKAWMTKILLNVVSDSLRKRSKYNEVIDREYGQEMLDTISDRSTAAENPEVKLAACEIHPDLLAALQRLPASLLHPLLLRELEDFSYEQIAALLDIPVGTVMSRLFRARRTVRDQLSGLYVGNKTSVHGGPQNEL